MAGYTRQDTANNIANGNVIDADDFDAEYNAVEGAFNASTGHKHDGTAGEGAPITKVGPSQNLVVSATNVNPKTSNTLDLGTNLLQYKDGYFDGTVYQDSAIVGVNAYMTLSDNEIDVSSGGLTLDVAGDISLDADGGDVLLKDAGTTFGTLTNDGNNLIVKSGSTTSITLSGANTTLAGTLAVTGATTLNGAVTVSGSNSVTIDAGNLTLSSGNATIGGTLSVTGEITGNASTATKLATARTITIDGDVDATATSFDGTGNITLTTTLDTVNSNVGSFGSATAIPVVTVNAKGLVTAVSTSAITTSLTVGADSGTNDAVALASDVLTFAGTTNEVETTVSNNQIQIGLPSNVTIGNNLTVTGDLEVQGTTVTLNTANLDIEDSTVRLAKNATTLSATNGAGIEFGANASKPTLTWDNSNSRLSSNKDFYAPNLRSSSVYGTLQTAAQPNITSVGTLSSLTVDEITINGSTISDSSLLTVSSGSVVKLDAASDIHLDATDTIYFYEAGNLAGGIVLDGPNNMYTFNSNTSVSEMKIGDGGVTVLRGLRVGDNGTATDNDIYAVADIEAGNSFKLGDWTITQSGSSLKFAYQGTNRLSLSSTGALTVENDVTAFGNA